MIDVTLRFTTLELAITALAAVRAAVPSGEEPKVVAAGNAPAAAKPKKDAAETKPSAAPAPTAASPTPPAESPSPTTSSASGPTREQVSAAVKAGAATNREAVVATLAKFGAKAAKDLKDDQLAEFSTALEAALKPSDDLG